MAVYQPKYTKNGKQLKSKTWWMEFVLKGERIRKTTGETNKRKAEAFEAAYKTQLLLGNIGIETEKKESKKEAPAFADAMKEFFDAAANQHNLAPSTLRRYKIASVALLKHFGNKKLDSITDKDINAYISKRLKQKSLITGGTIAPATVNRERTCLSRLFAYFKKEIKIINPFDFDDADEPTIEYLEEDNEVCNPLSLEEEERYLAECHPMLRDFAVIMIDTGMRNGEVLNLTVEDIDLAGGKLFVRTRQNQTRNSRKRRVKTKSARRTVFLTKRVKEILERRILNSTNGLLFAGGRDGKGDNPPNKLNNAHYAALRRSGVKRFRLYDLRHTFATRQAELGTDLITLKDLLGHKNLDMLKRYAHPSDEHKANAIQRMEAARASN